MELKTIFMRIIHFYFHLSYFRQKVPSAATLQLHSFQFDDFSLKDNDMLKVTCTLKKKLFISLKILFRPLYACSQTLISSIDLTLIISHCAGKTLLSKNWQNLDSCEFIHTIFLKDRSKRVKCLFSDGFAQWGEITGVWLTTTGDTPSMCVSSCSPS